MQLNFLKVMLFQSEKNGIIPYSTVLNATGLVDSTEYHQFNVSTTGRYKIFIAVRAIEGYNYSRSNGIWITLSRRNSTGYIVSEKYPVVTNTSQYIHLKKGTFELRLTSTTKYAYAVMISN